MDTCVSEFMDHVNSLSDGQSVVINHSHRFEQECLFMYEVIVFFSLFQNHTSYVLARCAYGHKEKNHRVNNFLGVFSKAFGNFAELQKSTAEKIACESRIVLDSYFSGTNCRYLPRNKANF